MNRVRRTLRALAHGSGLRRISPPERVGPRTVVLGARNLGRSYGSRTVLDDVSLDVRTGEVLALVGPNGAGKSTLLAALAGDSPPDRGEVTVLGRPLAEWSPAELALRRAVLPQNFTVSFPFDVIDVVYMGRAPWAAVGGADDDDRVVADAMAATEVTALASRKFPALSGGERARVMLARVLAQQTQVVLLDEPTAALDIRHQELVLRIARERAAQGDAVVVVLHDLALAAAYADRVAILSEGRIAAYGPPAEVFTARLLSDVYSYEVEIVSHPRTGAPLVLPVR
ncbi:heme ABC transporter ATP-binding protein [Thermobifida alba]|uniref:Heme ABC transporter ATP-binding protein n=1 Tax=Thermobifida alba TaxID=53522 RepID=A0ABY4L1Q7_THEAE|nr:heme ABC transporter ATP-binding protein [Thermobifida alba]UPT21600.1 heme ABC transporter ATP-binding protein [Thermobifida alba]